MTQKHETGVTLADWPVGYPFELYPAGLFRPSARLLPAPAEILPAVAEALPDVESIPAIAAIGIAGLALVLLRR